jgi:hypothetical protein
VHITIDSDPEPGTGAYYLARIGGLPGLARLYLEAGLLYLEGGAEGYLGAPKSRSNNGMGDSISSLDSNSHSSPAEEEERWRHEREMARKLFDRARMLDPHADIPVLAPEEPLESQVYGPKEEFLMPAPDFHFGGGEEKPRRRRRDPATAEREKQEALVRAEEGDMGDATWYLYLPGLIGAGTALFAVGLIGALSLGSWRKTQNS